MCLVALHIMALQLIHHSVSLQSPVFTSSTSNNDFGRKGQFSCLIVHVCLQFKNLIEKDINLVWQKELARVHISKNKCGHNFLHAISFNFPSPFVQAVPTSGKIASSNQGSTSGPSVLPQVTTGAAENIRAVRSGLLCPTYPLHRRAGRAAMVVRSPVCLEWQDHHHDKETFNGNRVGCLNSRLGGILQGDTNRWPLVFRGETVAYQLPGSSTSLLCSNMLCQRQEEHYSPTQNGQHHSSDVCEQAGWNSFS